MPIRSATIEELPVAMLPKGPACTRAGVFSSVCIRFGFMASFMITAMEPAALRSSAVMGFPSVSFPITMRPSLPLRSCREVASARIAITSDAAVMSEPVSRGTPSALGPAGDDVPQGPVVYVHHPSPRDGVPVHVEEVVVVVDVVIHHGGEQVVGSGDRVYVAGQVQIGHLHRHHLAVAAARSAALHPEHWPLRGP